MVSRKRLSNLKQMLLAMDRPPIHPQELPPRFHSSEWQSRFPERAEHRVLEQPNTVQETQLPEQPTPPRAEPQLPQPQAAPVQKQEEGEEHDKKEPVKRPHPTPEDRLRAFQRWWPAHLTAQGVTPESLGLLDFEGWDEMYEDIEIEIPSNLEEARQYVKVQLQKFLESLDDKRPS
jgi:hypothetical protein